MKPPYERTSRRLENCSAIISALTICFLCFVWHGPVVNTIWILGFYLLICRWYWVRWHWLSVETAQKSDLETGPEPIITSYEWMNLPLEKAYATVLKRQTETGNVLPKTATGRMLAGSYITHSEILERELGLRRDEIEFLKREMVNRDLQERNERMARTLGVSTKGTAGYQGYIGISGYCAWCGSREREHVCAPKV